MIVEPFQDSQFFPIHSYVFHLWLPLFNLFKFFDDPVNKIFILSYIKPYLLDFDDYYLNFAKAN